MKKKVLLGMSGGVDSSAAAIILKQKEYEVIGVTMKLWEQGPLINHANDAKKVCDKLNIEHHIFDCQNKFKEHVVNNFINCYECGKTPNPCVECNKYLKFGEFYKKAEELGCEYVATGHYAKVEYSEKYNQFVLKKAKEEKKDQSYFLYRIPREILSKLIFPLEDYSNKEDIRKIARENDLIVAEKKESQEICFIPDNDYVGFIKNNSNNKFQKGNIINTKGDILGTHDGIINYTVGQRKGLGVSYKEPLYVLRIDKQNNQVIVGTEQELYTNEVLVEDINYLVTDLENKEIEVEAKVRYRAKPAKAKLYPLENERAKFVFDEPQRAVTPGQSLVFCIDDIVVGGGKIV